MKRIIGLVFVLVLMFSISVSAQVTTDSTVTEVTSEVSEASTENLEKVEAIVDKANEKIEKKIDNAVAKSERIVAKYENDKLTEAEKDAKIDELVTGLIDKTNAISLKARTRCEKLGYTVECEWIEVEIDGQIILVDPLYIVGD